MLLLIAGCSVSLCLFECSFVFLEYTLYNYINRRCDERYGTGPLRRYVDILAQRQIAAVLRGTGYLGKKYLMETVRRPWCC